MTFFSSLIPSMNRAVVRRERAPNADRQEPSVRPHYEIKETDDAWGLTVYLPGVAKDGLEITAEDNQVRVFGRRAWKQPEGWTTLYRESSDMPFELVLEHDNALELDRIHAELKDGILRASLPKAAAVKPRRIAVS